MQRTGDKTNVLEQLSFIYYLAEEEDIKIIIIIINGINISKCDIPGHNLSPYEINFDLIKSYY